MELWGQQTKSQDMLSSLQGLRVSLSVYHQVWIYILGFCVLVAQQVRVQGVVLSLKPYLCLVIQQTHRRARSSGPQDKENPAA